MIAQFSTDLYYKKVEMLLLDKHKITYNCFISQTDIQIPKTKLSNLCC